MFRKFFMAVPIAALAVGGIDRVRDARSSCARASAK